MIYIVTASNEKVESYAKLTRANVLAYCRKHGYQFVHVHPLHDAWDKAVSPAWNLVAAIRWTMNLMADGDWLTLLGSDAAIVDMDFDLEKFIEEQAPFKITWANIVEGIQTNGKGPYSNIDILITRDKNGLNDGGMLLRKSAWSLELVERWWNAKGTECEVFTNGTCHWWAEQSYLFYLLQEDGVTGVFRYEGQPDGVFSINDPFFSTKSFKAMPDIDKHVAFIPQNTTNAYPRELFGDEEGCDPVFVVHLPGKTTEERTAYFQKLLI